MKPGRWLQQDGRAVVSEQQKGNGAGAMAVPPEGVVAADARPRSPLHARLQAMLPGPALRFTSIRTKIVLLMTLVGAVLVMLCGAFVLYDFNRELSRASSARAAGAADALAFAAGQAKSADDIAPVIGAIAGTRSLRAAGLALPDGRIIISSQEDWIGKTIDVEEAHDAARPVHISTQEELGGYGQYPGDYVWTLPLPDAGTSLIVLARVDVDRLASLIVIDAWHMMLWLVIAVVLAVLSVSLLLYRVIVTPIETLRDYAAADGAGDMHITQPHDEIGTIVNALRLSFHARSDGEARLEALAATDGLTGIGNRTFFKKRLAEEISKSERHGHMVGVMVLNLDDFKNVNDTLGPDAGDRVLQRTADILKCCAREGDIVARMGGDEFGIIMPGIKTADDAMQLASRLVRAVGAPFRLGSTELQQASCVGITLFPQDGRDDDVLLRTADLALSRAKQEGAGACVLYRHELHLRAIERNMIERDLRAALANNQLSLFYQPKVDIATGRVIGMEALIRWRHEERGYIPPSVFIPVAERCGLIVPLTKWVLDEACRQNRDWQDRDLNRIGVAVNVSALDLRRTDLTDTIANTLIRRGLSPQYLELEVTESMVMQDVDVVIGTLRRLRGLGVGISIDDFGTGYSSLAYLKRFPVKRLKIDRSFVQDVADGREGHVIPKVIIDLAHALGVKVVAEGVESAAQYEALRDLGCDEVQGYFAGRPMPAAEFELFLRNSPAGRFDTEETQRKTQLIA